ncbi:MAG: SusC/RagA family TonB-linked outer membrane protein [Adhaeribacter sp.]
MMDKKLIITAFLLLLALHTAWAQGTITGSITSESGEPLPGVTIVEKGTSNGTATDVAGKYSLQASGSDPILVVSYIGYGTQELKVGSRTTINVSLKPDAKALEEVVVVGYGQQRRGSITGSIESVNSEELTEVPAPTISQALIGKVAGVTTRVPDGRPGAAANLQIRNMGNPLYVIDGVQSGEGQFNQLGPDDIESISILKDASAAIYGLKAANGVVLVTTKKGGRNKENTINVNTYYGWQSLTRFPKPASAADLVRARAEAEINESGFTNITAEEIAKWQAGTEPGYRGFDWSSYIGENAPQKYINLNTTGGSEKTNYYFSVSHLNQDAVFKGYNFSRTNLQTNIDTEIGKRLKAGVRINGKIENRDLLGLVGGDNYEQSLLGIFRNLPTERPYANDNPLYPNTTTNFSSNYAVFEYSGYNTDLWRSIQTNFNLDYEFPVKGLTATGMYAFFYNNGLADEFEKTFNTYDYDEATQTYTVTGGQRNPYRTRRNQYITDNILRGQLNYKRKFGRHNVAAMVGAEAQDRLHKNFFLHAQPSNNYIDLLNQVSEVRTVTDVVSESAQAGIIFRANYDFKDKYLLEVAGRYDGSYLFPPGHRWGLFPSVSAGWRISEEAFLKNSGLSHVVSDLKLRASYGQMGDEPGSLPPFSYLAGYDYYTGSSFLDGDLVTGSKSRGMPVKTLSWINATMANAGLDFSLWEGRLSGSFDAFYRKRTGLPGQRDDVLIPTEVDIPLPPENLAADAHMGLETALRHVNQVGQVRYSLGANATLARKKNLYSYKPRFGSAWDRYKTSSEDRWTGINWGYEYIGQFQSEEEIANYPVDIDGFNNTTLLPGDLIYRDVNNDGVINGLDERPNGYGENQLPYLSYGLQAGVEYKGLDLSVNFSGATLQSRGRNAEIKIPFQSDANSPEYLLNDRWHREDIFNPDSPWIPGRYPALRKNPVPSNNRGSNFWYTNIAYLRLRNLQLGYNLPGSLTQKLKISKIRLYLNGTNLFSLDNVREFGVDPETQKSNGLDYPAQRVLNVGANITI